MLYNEEPLDAWGREFILKAARHAAGRVSMASWSPGKGARTQRELSNRDRSPRSNGDLIRVADFVLYAVPTSLEQRICQLFAD